MANKKSAKPKSKKSKKLWGGGYGKKTASVVEAFTESVSFDKRLALFDIKGSIAHAEMLGKQKLIPSQDATKIKKGLQAIAVQIEKGKFAWSIALEDVHMNIESALTAKIGDAGARLHTGRSRNDQVATTFRLFCADASRTIQQTITGLQKAIKSTVRKNGKHILPGYTHLQQAQPVTFAAHFGAYHEMLSRDLKRFIDAEASAMAEMPLGSAALAGTTLKLDRKYTCKKLGFKKPSANSMDAVSNRDFAVELVFACALLNVHLSRLSEDLVIFSSVEFGFVRLDDAVTTGSSLMPQKKNPDVAELARGKTGRVVGDLVSLLTMLKGLPMTYNRDMQEDKEPVFDAVDTAAACALVLTEAVGSMEFNSKRARDVMDLSMMATDLAEHLVTEGVPFRHAHEIVARFVHSHKNLEDVTEQELMKAHPALKNSKKRLSYDEGVKRRKLPKK
ncbi:MAG: argininosuccinate lyase [Candidatus Lindowbacteria bacterium]|nr:argininosuccinate lyase [Candidatus Lindowbacteria bacterium]